MQSTKSDTGPAVLNESLHLSKLYEILMQTGLRVKVARSTLPDTCLFPKLSVAFLILSLSLDDYTDTTSIMARIKTFISLHRQSYVIVLAKDNKIINFIGNIQLQLCPQEVCTIFVSNYQEIVEVMGNLTATIQPQVKQVFEEKVGSVLSGCMLNVIRSIGCMHHDGETTIKNIGSVSNVVRTSLEQFK